MKKNVYKLHTHLIKTGHQYDPLPLRRLLLLSCAASLSYALSVFNSIPSPDTFALNTIIRACSHTAPSQSLTLFTNMCRAGISPDNFTFPFLLKACSVLRTSGQDLHCLILKLGFHSNIFVQNALIHCYGSCGMVDSAWRLFEEMLVRDLVSWSSMITCLVNNGFSQEALWLFREMQLSNIQSDEVTMVSLITAVSNLGALSMGRWVHLFVRRNGLDLTISLGTALINMYSRCGSIEGAVKVFDEMPIKNVITWTALINGLAVHGRSKEALMMFYEMKKSGIKPDYITLVGVLVACSHGGLLDEGWQVFESIRKEYGMEPRLEHYGCMVDLLGRAGLLKEAFEFIERMPTGPNAIIWRTLLGACVNYNSLELAKIVKERLSELDPYHDGDYVLLSNVYGGTNQWVEKAGVRSLMREKRIGKTPGCSLIEVDGMIYEFAVGDDSHPQLKMIREVLRSIIERLRLTGYTPDTANVLFDIEEEEKERNVNYHSEKLAVAFALLSNNYVKTIKVMKNLRICFDCHHFMKFVAQDFNIEIIIRDRSRFHHFEGGTCSCKDYW